LIQPAKQSSIAARTRSVTLAAVASQSNGMEISTSGYDVIHTANLRRSWAATIRALEAFAQMPTGSNDGRFKFRPAIPRHGVGIEDQ